ncbi:hypothetical protein RD792_014684 [Penstemon davidsonii]|uniref:DUF4743 domain-containing protein n=1 Tax=Penstemon davidsonii TaxID=160366 RepID=A0ABR0CRK0_9LAMI|nr:hypothetical protein RD792_014684 [Penstemon davidsonii]
MASNWCCHHLSHKFLFRSPSSPAVLQRRLKFPFCPPHSVISASASFTHSSDFTWDDVVRLSQSQPKQNDSSDLRGFFEKVTLCNRNSEKQCEFIPFVIEGQIVGYVHSGFSEHLRRYEHVFTFPVDTSFGRHVALHPSLNSPEYRTEAVGDVIKSLSEKHIPGIRNELYPVTSSFGTPEFFSLERAAAPYFGIKAYGVHMNGYVERDGEKYLWIAKRSKVKPTYPGKLDHLVAGGLPHGISCGENLVKECEEEAGIPRSISSK